MKEEDDGEDIFLVCFYIIQKNDKFSLTQKFIKVTDTKVKVDTDYDAVSTKEISEVKQIKSVINNDGNNALVCCLFTNNKISCYKFHFVYGYISDTVEFYDERSLEFNCQNVLYGMKLDYSPIGQKIYLSCISGISTVKARFFDKELNLIDSDIYEQFTQCSSIYGHSIVYNSVYYVISDVICDNYKRNYELLDGELSPIVIITTTQKVEYLDEKEEEKEKVEESKEEEKNEEIIEEKKEEEIAKEIEEEIEEKMKENENIKEKEKEKDEEKKEEKEEELEEQIKEKIEESLEKEIKESVTKEESNQIIEEKFDCSILEKCKECDRESFNKNLCINCNNKKNYYYLNSYPSKPRNKYIECVNEITKPSDFYFNKINLDYEPSFTTCATCEYGGNYEQNNCTSCDGINYIKNPRRKKFIKLCNKM